MKLKRVASYTLWKGHKYEGSVLPMSSIFLGQGVGRSVVHWFVLLLSRDSWLR